MRWVAVLAALPFLVAASAAAAVHTVALSYQVHDPRWSPSGSRLAYVVTHGDVDQHGFANPRWRARIWIVDADDRHAHPLTPRQFNVEDIAWAPDGSAIAYAAGGHLWRYDLSSRDLEQLTYGRYDQSWWPAWSPDGSTIAYTQHYRFDESVYVLPSGGGTARLLSYGRERPTWSPDGTRLLLQRPTVFINLDGSGLVPADSNGCYPRGWSADTSLVVGIQYTPVANGLSLCAFNTSTGERLAGWSAGVRISPTSPTLSADNRVFAFTGGLSGRVFLLPRHGNLRLLLGSDSASEGPSWSRAGLVAYIARGSCGRHSEVRIADEDGTHVRTLARAC